MHRSVQCCSGFGNHHSSCLRRAPVHFYKCLCRSIGWLDKHGRFWGRTCHPRLLSNKMSRSLGRAVCTWHLLLCMRHSLCRASDTSPLYLLAGCSKNRHSHNRHLQCTGRLDLRCRLCRCNRRPFHLCRSLSRRGGLHLCTCPTGCLNSSVCLLYRCPHLWWLQDRSSKLVCLHLCTCCTLVRCRRRHHHNYRLGCCHTFPSLLV